MKGYYGGRWYGYFFTVYKVLNTGKLLRVDLAAQSVEEGQSEFFSVLTLTTSTDQ